MTHKKAAMNSLGILELHDQFRISIGWVYLSVGGCRLEKSKRVDGLFETMHCRQQAIIGTENLLHRCVDNVKPRTARVPAVKCMNCTAIRTQDEQSTRP